MLVQHLATANRGRHVLRDTARSANLLRCGFSPTACAPIDPQSERRTRKSTSRECTVGEHGREPDGSRRLNWDDRACSIGWIPVATEPAIARLSSERPTGPAAPAAGCDRYSHETCRPKPYQRGPSVYRLGSAPARPFKEAFTPYSVQLSPLVTREMRRTRDLGASSPIQMVPACTLAIFSSEPTTLARAKLAVAARLALSR